MFERFSEPARRALFFARYEVTQFGGTTIEPEHLVLGAIRSNPAAIGRFITVGDVGSLQAGVEALLPRGEKVSTSVEIPFSARAKEALERAAGEADDLKNVVIRPEHLLLGVMVKAGDAVTRALHDAGITIGGLREVLAQLPEEPRDLPAELRLPRPGMIVRQWTGVVHRGREAEYLAHLRETLRTLERLQGFVAASVLQRDVDDGTEFQVVTTWRAAADIAAFAGADLTRAVVPPAVQALMVRFDERAVHYQLLQ